MSQENIALVKSIYAAYARGDIAAALSQMAPHITVVQSPELPWGGTFQGIDGVKKFYELLGKHLRGTGLPIERFLDAGDHVVAIGRTQGTVAANGRPFDVPLAHVWQLKDGLVVAFRPFIDHPTMQATLEE